MKVIFFTITLILSISMYAQNPYYDALKLSALKYKTDGKIKFAAGQDSEIYKICAKYTSANSYPELQKEFDTNEFIAFIKNDGSSVDKNNASPFSALSNAISGANVTSVADGLAKFLVDRTKQELSLTFFEKFKTELDKSDELRLLFPQTKRVLDAIGEEVYMYTNYLNSLREAFNKDLNNILVGLESYVNEKVDNKAISEPFGDALYFTNLIKNGEHPGEAINLLAGRTGSYIDNNYKEFRESLIVLNAFSQSLRYRTDSLYWIPSDSLSLLFEKNTFQIYLGLMYQKHQKLPLAGKTFGEYLIAIKDEVDKIKPPIRAMAKSAEAIDVSIKSIKEKKTNGEKIESYFEVFNGTTDLLSKSVLLIDQIDSSQKALIKNINQYVYVMRLINDIYLDVNEKQYSSLVIDIVALGDTLNINKDGKNLFGGNFLKYGSFMANVAQAESSDDVTSAIESIALPAGSASIKKKSKFNIALNGYVGLAGGAERNGETEDWAGIFSLYTPVGVAFSKGKEKPSGDKGKKYISNTLFLSAVDISAFSLYRFSDDDTENLPEVTLSNIFAPGLYYIRGFKNAPVSWGIGGQLGPQLRKIDNTSATLSNGVNYSFRTFIAVDIPLLNFYTKSR